MQRLFEVKPWVHRSLGVRYAIDATREFFMPSVTCDACGGFFSSGIDYPGVDLDGFLERERVRRPRRTTPEEYDELANRLQSWLNWSTPPAPGSTFGPLIGSIEGTLPDFAEVPGKRCLLAGRSCIARLWSVEGLVLPPVVPTRVASTEGRDALLSEIDCERIGRIHPSAYATTPTPTCERCRMGGQFRVDDIVLSADTLGHLPDVFRVLDRPTVVIGTDRLKAAVTEAGLVGIRFGLAVEVK